MVGEGSIGCRKIKDTSKRRIRDRERLGMTVTEVDHMVYKIEEVWRIEVGQELEKNGKWERQCGSFGIDREEIGISEIREKEERCESD